jgi:hypothetical protein
VTPSLRVFAFIELTLEREVRAKGEEGDEGVRLDASFSYRREKSASPRRCPRFSSNASLLFSDAAHCMRMGACVKPSAAKQTGERSSSARSG